MKVTLREKKLRKGHRSLYLDFYPPIIQTETGKQTRREHLKLYIYEKPKNENEREHNKETKILADNIRAKRQLDIQAGNYGFISQRNRQKDFIAYVRGICDQKETDKNSSYYTYKSILKHLEGFRPNMRFADVTEKFCKEFKEYLESKAGLSPNSASNYFDVFKTIIKNLTKEGLLTNNPTESIKSPEKQESQREFVTLDELQKLVKAECKSDELKRAALFSALTGLRFSDIKKLLWSEIQHSTEQGGYYIRFRQKKTKGAESLPISGQAFELLGQRKEPNEQVFKKLDKWLCWYYLPEWITNAGIDRKITFHSFRHTYATLQLTLGTDIFTISKMLGHRNLKTTEIYAKIIDLKKREAANKIILNIEI